MIKISKSASTAQTTLKKNFEKSVEKAWVEYKAGKFITHEDLIKKHDLSVDIY